MIQMSFFPDKYIKIALILLEYMSLHVLQMVTYRFFALAFISLRLPLEQWKETAMHCNLFKELISICTHLKRPFN